MAKKNKMQSNDGIVTVELYYKKSTGEWLVKWFENGEYVQKRTYYTDDKTDAYDTMQYMMDRYNKQTSTTTNYHNDINLIDGLMASGLNPIIID